MFITYKFIHTPFCDFAVIPVNCYYFDGKCADNASQLTTKVLVYIYVH